MSTPAGPQPETVPAAELVDALEQQIGQAAGQVTRLQIALRKRDEVLQARDDEIRYLKSRLPADDETPEG